MCVIYSYFNEFTRFIIIFSILFTLLEGFQYSSCSDVEMHELWYMEKMHLVLLSWIKPWVPVFFVLFYFFRVLFEIGMRL